MERMLILVALPGLGGLEVSVNSVLGLSEGEGEGPVACGGTVWNARRPHATCGSGTTSGDIAEVGVLTGVDIGRKISHI